MRDIEYTNIMLELEKLEEKIERLEREVLILQRFADTSLKEKCYGKSGPNTPVVVEDFSRFWNEERVTKFNNLKVNTLPVETTCLWANLTEEERNKPVGISCPCKNCSPYRC